MGAPVFLAAAVLGIAAAALPDPAPPVPADDAPTYSAVASVSIGDQCSAILIDTGADSAPAYLLTNGHCAAGRDAGPNEVVIGAPGVYGEARFAPTGNNLDGLASVPVASVPYSTMQGYDLSVVELDATLGSLRAAGITPAAIASTPPTPGDLVTNAGVPVQGLFPSDWVLRAGDCVLGEQVDLLEFDWHFDNSWSNDCPGIRGGSSGSPLFDASGSVVALINTTTAGAEPIGGDCYLGKPCERMDGTTVVVPDRSYAVPLDGVDKCFVNGVFALGAADCPLPQGTGPDLRIYDRAIRTDATAGVAVTRALFEEEPGTQVVTKLGPAGTTRCTDADGYGEPVELSQEWVDGGLPVEVDETGDAMYVFCAAWPDDFATAATAVIQVDNTPPQRVPELSVNDLGNEQLIEPLFSLPELMDFLVKIGPAGETDCASAEGYERYLRFGWFVPTTDLPVSVCVIGFDEAGNESEPHEIVVEQPGGTEVSEPAAATITVSGDVLYFQRIAMPDGAVVTVTISDVSRADAVAPVLAEQVIEDPTNVPVPFELTLDTSDLDPRGTYAIRATITVGDDLWWSTTTAHHIDINESTADLELVLDMVK